MEWFPRERSRGLLPEKNPLIINLLNRQEAARSAAALDFSEMESLILAQNERWRHGLGMQVERGAAMRPVAKG